MKTELPERKIKKLRICTQSISSFLDSFSLFISPVSRKMFFPICFVVIYCFWGSETEGNNRAVTDTPTHCHNSLLYIIFCLFSSFLSISPLSFCGFSSPIHFIWFSLDALLFSIHILPLLIFVIPLSFPPFYFFPSFHLPLPIHLSLLPSHWFLSSFISLIIFPPIILPSFSLIHILFILSFLLLFLHFHSSHFPSSSFRP